MIELAIIQYVYDPRFDDADAMVDRFGLLRMWAEGVQEAGGKVTVFQRFGRDAVVERNGVCYRMLGDRFPPWLRRWHVPRRLHAAVNAHGRQAVEAGRPALVHVGGLVFPTQTGRLRRVLPRECALAVQHHAELPSRGFRRYLQGWGLRGVDGFLFVNHELAAAWVERRIIPSRDRVYEVMECSSALSYQDRDAARAITGMTGDPVMLWAGNLTPNKDPLTILAGLELVVPQVPAARLYMAFRESVLLGQVRARIAASELLRPRVSLLGTIPYDRIGPYFNSADVFVQGSAKEGSGIAVLDALACGVVPVVSDIPPFRTLLDGGAVGGLWPVGDARRLADALLRVLQTPLPTQSRAARALYERCWSCSAVGRRALEVYLEIVRRRGAGVAGARC